MIFVSLQHPYQLFRESRCINKLSAGLVLPFKSANIKIDTMRTLWWNQNLPILTWELRLALPMLHVNMDAETMTINALLWRQWSTQRTSGPVSRSIQQKSFASCFDICLLLEGSSLGFLNFCCLLGVNKVFQLLLECPDPILHSAEFSPLVGGIYGESNPDNTIGSPNIWVGFRMFCTSLPLTLDLILQWISTSAIAIIIISCSHCKTMMEQIWVNLSGWALQVSFYLYGDHKP